MGPSYLNCFLKRDQLKMKLANLKTHRLENGPYFFLYIYIYIYIFIIICICIYMYIYIYGVSLVMWRRD